MNSKQLRFHGAHPFKHAKWPPSDLTPWTLTLITLLFGDLFEIFLGAIDSHRSSCNNVQQLLDHHPDTGQDADISDLSEPQYANVGPNAGNR